MYDYEKFTDEIMGALLSDPFSRRKMKMLSRSDGYLLCGKLGVDVSSTSELLYPNRKNRFRLIRARTKFYKISFNFNVSLGIFECSLNTRHFALEEDCQKKRMGVFAYIPVDFNYFEIQSETFIIPARKNLFVQENIFNKAPVRRVAIAMNAVSAFTGSHTEEPFWYQQFDPRQIRVLRGGQPVVHNDVADNCCLYVTTMKPMNFQDDIPSIPIENFKDHCVVVFDLIRIE